MLLYCEQDVVWYCLSELNQKKRKKDLWILFHVGLKSQYIIRISSKMCVPIVSLMLAFELYIANKLYDSLA